MSILFSEFIINNLVLKNRFIMSAAADNLENDKVARIERFSELAKGQVGLIISGGTRFNKIEALADVINAVHNNGGKFAVQFVAESGPGSYLGLPSVRENAIAVSVLPKEHYYFKSVVPFLSMRNIMKLRMQSLRK